MNQEKLLNTTDKYEDTVADQLAGQNTNQDRSDIESKDNSVNFQTQKDDKSIELNKMTQGFQRAYTDMERGEFFNPRKPFFSLEMAKRHARANRVYKESMDSSTMSDTLNTNPDDICPCCYHVVQSDNHLIDVFKSTYKDIAHLGPTYPMYFQFLRYSIAFTSIIFLVSGIYNLVANEKGTYCQELSETYKDDPTKLCHVSIINTTAGSNRGGSDPDSAGAILNLITCILLMVFSTGYRYRQMQFEREIDQSDISVSDYTLFINKIPVNKNKQEITDFLQSQVPGIKVEKIVQCFKLQQYNQMNSSMLKSRVDTVKDDLINSMDAYERQCFNEQNIHDIFSGAAFVCLEKEEQVVKVVEHFDYSFWKQFFGIQKQDQSKLFDGSQLNVAQAKEPGDTNWDNFEIPTKSKYIRRSITLSLTLIFLGLSFWAIFLVGDKQGEIRKTETNQVKLLALSGLSSMITVMINQALQQMIQYFAEFEAYNFKTDTIISVAKKSGIAQFINTTIVSFFVAIILNGRNVWINGGLVNSITILAVSNAFAPAVISLMQAENIQKWVYQKIFLSVSEKYQKQFSQMFVHNLFERPIFNPAACFAAAANCLLFAAFYSWIIPIALPFCILSLILQFYVNKYKLLRRQSIPIPLGTSLPEEMIDFYFEIIILFFSLGCLAFEYILYEKVHVCTIINVVFAGVFFFLPINEYLDEKFNKDSNYVETMTYLEAKTSGQFSQDYDRKNPILRSRAIKKYVNHLIDNEKDQGKKDQLHSVFYIQPSSKLYNSAQI